MFCIQHIDMLISHSMTTDSSYLCTRSRRPGEGLMNDGRQADMYLRWGWAAVLNRWNIPVATFAFLTWAVVVVAGLRHKRKIVSLSKAFSIDYATAVFVGRPPI